MNEINQIQDHGCTPGTCPSELELEQLHLGECEPIHRSTLERAIDACAGCAARFKALSMGFDAFPSLDASALNQRILDGFQGSLPDALSNALASSETKTPEPKSMWQNLSAWLRTPSAGFAMVGLAAAVLLSVALPRLMADPNQEPGIRMKGSLTVNIQRERDGKGEPVKSGDVFKAGDRIRIEVLTQREGHLLILGREHSGKSYVAYPIKGGGHAAPKAAGRQILPEAMELDASGGREILHTIFCETPFQKSDILFKKRSAPELPKGCQRTAFILNKSP